jgi:hypothetical protein
MVVNCHLVTMLAIKRFYNISSYFHEHNFITGAGKERPDKRAADVSRAVL